MTYADVILPVKLPWCPVYRLEDGIGPGTRVSVRLGRKEYVGVVWHIVANPQLSPEKISEAGLTGLPPVSAEEILFWEFLSEYYLCTIGEVYKAAYPSTKIRSESIALDVAERSEAARLRSLAARTALMEKRVAVLSARLSAREKALADRIVLEQGGGRVKRSSGIRQKLMDERDRVASELFAARTALAEIQSSELVPVGTNEGHYVGKVHELPPKPLVIHSPDRSREYSEAVRSTLEEGRQVLVLAPEKAFLERMRAVVGDACGGEMEVYSSDLTPVGRRKISDRVRDGLPLVLGTRSALFLPWRDLGLVIVDEEQDSCYKQTEPSPRFHGRDAAMALAGIHRARVVLGTPSPSLETLYNCRTGRYELETCIRPPVGTDIVDVGEERRKNGMVGPVSRRLVRAIAHCGGKAVVIRGWEKPAELNFQETNPGDDVEVMSLSELKSVGAPSVSVLGVLQADAFVSRDDFRADERAVQLVAQLASMTPSLVIQTAVPDRFNGVRSLDELLAERRDFGLPPFTRLLDVILEDGSEKRLAFMSGKLASRLGAMPAPSGPGTCRLRLSLPRGRDLAARKKEIQSCIQAFESEWKYAGHVTIDVDPQ